ncbi:MAG: hypothetical protein LIP00_10830 [Parabacteroides sp.]|nr:hypothetical protein [Parabacteroides sp.]
MKLQREIGFNVEGVDGKPEAITGPFACKVYQDGRLSEGKRQVYPVNL